MNTSWMELAGWATAFATKALLFFYLPGAAWRWLIAGTEPLRLRRWVTASAESVLLSVAISVPLVLALGEAGWFHPVVIRSALAMIAVLGVMVGVRRSARGWGADTLPGLVVVAAILAGGYILPERGEWLLGGWDPGVYMNEGVRLSRTGGFEPPADSCYEAMTESASDLELWTRIINGQPEAFPGVPVDPASGVLKTTFFRGTSATIAMLHQSGGLRAAVRSSLFLAALSVLVLAALLVTAGLSAPGAIVAVAVFALQPILLYHTHTPASEMLELLLVCGLGYGLCRRESSLGGAALGAALMFLAAANRISFELFGALFVLASAAADVGAPRRQAITSHALLAAGLAAGVCYDVVLVPAALQKLGHVLPRIHVASAGVLLVAGVVDVLSLRAGWREKLQRVAAWSPAMLVPAVIVLALACVLRWPNVVELRHNVASLIPYFGIGAGCLASAGFFLVMLRVKDRSAIRCLAAFLAVAVFVTLWQKHVADFYPWATKRFLSFGVTGVALWSGFAAAELWRISRAGPRVVRRGVTVLLACVVAAGFPQAWRAWSRTSYDGVGQQLAEVARRTGEGDVIVADHFRWGMPLSFIEGRQVLNGERIWSSADPTAGPRAAGFLRRLRGDGHRVWLFTSSDEGLLVFPYELRSGQDVWTASFHYAETVQHPRAAEFNLRDKEARFVLRLWDGG